MPEFDPQILQKWSGGRWFGPPPAPVRGFTFDSRRAAAGDLFVCLKTERRDGHEFIGSAAEAGAAAALVSRPDESVPLPQLVVPDPLRALQEIAAAHRRTFRGPVIGISGSCGKTSTKDLLALLLGGSSVVHATEGNLNNLIGVPVTLLGIDSGKHRAAVIEAGINEPGEMRRLAEVSQPTAAIITNVGPVHLERLGSIEGVAREKAMLPRAVPADGIAVFPRECLRHAPFQGLRARTIAPAFRVEPRAEETLLHLEDSRGGESVFALRKVSRGMAANAALAIEMARALGVEDSAIEARLRDWAPARFRGQLVRLGEATVYVDCYNANPPAMADALAHFAEMAEGDKARLYVLGCMGELGSSSGEFHEEVGRRIHLRSQDKAFVTGADADRLRAGILQSGGSAGQVRIFGDFAEVEEAVAAHHGYVLLKGSRVYGLERLLDRVRVRKEATC